MSNPSDLPSGTRLNRLAPEEPQTAELALKNFRYVVGAVNDNALAVWTELWEQLEHGLSPSGMVLPHSEQGFQPPCGWPEFLEKFWLLKHYLDYTHRFCQESRRSQ
jgi:peptide methionine sulfoxide reductase MsrB